MANRKELRDARRRVRASIESLAAIERLPRYVGQRVQWNNGVVWERQGDDAWIALSDTQIIYPSAHVASLPWSRVLP